MECRPLSDRNLRPELSGRTHSAIGSTASPVGVTSPAALRSDFMHRRRDSLFAFWSSCYISLISGIEVVIMQRAKIFWSGRSQAVRLPKDFRLPGEEVRIRRHGSAVILEPVAEDWAWLDSIAGKLDQDFVEAAHEGVAEQERPALEKMFR